MIVSYLNQKLQGSRRIVSKEYLTLSMNGVVGSPDTSPLRHVLIVRINALRKFAIKPGGLMENIVVEGLPTDISSGDVLEIKGTKIRLTIPCETCKKISDVVDLKLINGNRGFLGQVVSPGKIWVGDRVKIHRGQFEEIPTRISDRIKWFLNLNPRPIYLSDLVHEIGLNRAYSRAIPRIIKERSDISKDLIMIKSRGSTLG